MRRRAGDASSPADPAATPADPAMAATAPPADPGYGIGLKVSISSSKTGRNWFHLLAGAVMYIA
jgi:hypothetical protein